MTSYIEWNSLLLEEYFSPSNAFQDVWIPTNRLELEGIGVHLGGANGLIEAVKEGPPWPHESGHIGIKAEELARQRQLLGFSLACANCNAPVKPAWPRCPACRTPLPKSGVE